MKRYAYLTTVHTSECRVNGGVTEGTGVRVSGLALVLACAIAMTLATPLVAGALDSGRAVPTLLLGFGDSYGAEPRKHSGIDVSIGSGSVARSAVGGLVTFAGLVPAISGDLRVGAITVRGGDGHLITLSPLNDLAVVKGDSVEPGQPIGSVAASGDGSSAGAHLHLSERSNDRYIDPTHLLDGWFASYVENGATGEAVVEGSAVSDGAVRPRPRSHAPTRTQTTSATVGSVLGATSAVATPAFVAYPVGSLGLMLNRELVSHPPTTLGVSSSAVQEASTESGAATHHPGQTRPVSQQEAPRMHVMFIDSIRYLGVGLVTLAAGLGFALHTVGKPEKNATLHRLGSLFAVRGERW